MHKSRGEEQQLVKFGRGKQMDKLGLADSREKTLGKTEKQDLHFRKCKCLRNWQLWISLDPRGKCKSELKKIVCSLP